VRLPFCTGQKRDQVNTRVLKEQGSLGAELVQDGNCHEDREKAAKEKQALDDGFTDTPMAT
jgi:hypothetical protein